MELMIAIVRVDLFVIYLSFDMIRYISHAGSLSIRELTPPILAICCIWSRKPTDRILSSLQLFGKLFSLAMVYLPLHLLHQTEYIPIPRMREPCAPDEKVEAHRLFANTQKLIGLPVIWRMESAAPPARHHRSWSAPHRSVAVHH